MYRLVSLYVFVGGNGSNLGWMVTQMKKVEMAVDIDG